MDAANHSDPATAETRLQLALTAGRLGTWSYNLLTGEQVWDAQQYALFGVSPELQPTRELFEELVLPEDRVAVELASPDLKPGARHAGQFRIRRPDGQIRWLISHSLTVGDANGRPIELVGVNWDITDQKLAEDVLQNNAEQLQLALDAGRMGTWRYDLRTGHQQWNARQFELFGLPPDTEPSRELFASLVVPEDLPKIGFTDDDLRPGHFHDTEFRIRRPNGEVRWLTARSFARHDVEGRPIERIGVNWDVTERRLAEERMLTTTRELQHRVKNSLTVVQAIAAQSFRSAKTKEDGLAAFTGRLQALATATELITRGNWATIAIGDIAGEIIKPYRDAGSDRITMAGPPIRIDSKNATSLGMALHELCTNALKYGALSNDAGTVAINWSREDDWLHLRWQEVGGPPVPPRPSRGFGTRLLAGGLFDPGTGSVDLSFEPSGVVCAIRVALAGSSSGLHTDGRG